MTAINMKNTIRYARTYRYLMLNKKRLVLLLLCLVLPSSAFWGVFSEDVTQMIAEISGKILATGFGTDAFLLDAAEFSLGHIHYLASEGRMPAILFSLENFLLTLGVLFCLTFF